MVSPADYQHEMIQYAARKGQDNVGEDFRIDTIKIFTEGTDFALMEPYEEEFLKEYGLASGYKGSGYWKDDVLKATIENALRSDFLMYISTRWEMLLSSSLPIAWHRARKIQESEKEM